MLDALILLHNGSYAVILLEIVVAEVKYFKGFMALKSPFDPLHIGSYPQAHVDETQLFQALHFPASFDDCFQAPFVNAHILHVDDIQINMMLFALQ